ncbi:MAG: hypothetical protein HFF06_01480 [Oscillospiraceae bacterium]|jgi:hypothetical protein|nr:hypothetical protein [Oscillospiraceae bacterium]
MSRNKPPLRQGALTFAAVAGVTILLELLLAAVGLPGVIAFFCPWVIWEYGNDPIIILTVACLIGLPAGFLSWLSHTLDGMRSSYGRMITELKTRIETLEEKLNSITKD